MYNHTFIEKLSQINVNFHTVPKIEKKVDVMYLVFNVVIHVQASYSSYGYLWSSLQCEISVPNSVYLLG